LHLAGCSHYFITDARSHKHQTNIHFLSYLSTFFLE